MDDTDRDDERGTPESREIGAALAATGLKPVNIAIEVGRTEQMAARYITGAVEPSGGVLLKMLRKVPGFAERLGFAVRDNAA